MTPFFRWIVGELRTGRIVRELDLIDGSWSDDIADSGSLRGAFPLRSVDPAWPTAEADAAAARSFLAVAYVDAAGTEHMLAGGPIWTHDYARSTGILRLGAAGFSSLWDHRKLLPVLSEGERAANAEVTYTGAERALIAKRLIELAGEHVGGDLPIVLPTDEALGGEGTTYSATFFGYDLASIGERLTGLSEQAGGPEVRFRPRRSLSDPRFMEWVAEFGMEANGGKVIQVGDPILLDATVPSTSNDAYVGEITVQASGSEIGMRAWAAGGGDGKGRLIGSAVNEELLALGYPLLEVESQATDTIRTEATLNLRAAELVAARARPIKSYRVEIKRDSVVHPGRLLAGNNVVLRITGDPYIGDGDHLLRVLEVSGGATMTTLLLAASND